MKTKANGCGPCSAKPTRPLDMRLERAVMGRAIDRRELLGQQPSQQRKRLAVRLDEHPADP
jgi:hypothetical protein